MITEDTIDDIVWNDENEFGRVLDALAKRKGHAIYSSTNRPPNTWLAFQSDGHNTICCICLAQFKERQGGGIDTKELGAHGFEHLKESGLLVLL